MPQEFPPHARKVFSGVLFEIWQWEQELYDGSTATFEKLCRQNTASVLATVGDKILLQEQEQPDKPGPFPSIPGGRIERDEDPLEGATRELLEETGYVSDNWNIWREVRPSHKMAWTVYIYIARNCRRVAEPRLDPGEKITTKLVEFDELLALSDNPLFYDRELVTEFLRMRLDKVRLEKFKSLLFNSIP